MTDITELAETLHANARSKGFYDHEDRLLKGSAHIPEANMKTILAEHYGNRLMLIAGEAVEAHEEVRSGRGVAELYFSANGKGEYSTPTHPEERYPLKPEGVLAELADIAIRTLETMAGILAAASDEEKAKLRAQVPQNEASVVNISDAPVGPDEYPAIELGPVNVGEVIILKHEYNVQRSHMNGGRKF